MGSKTIKTALVVGAIAVGFAAIPAIGPSAFATKVTNKYPNIKPKTAPNTAPMVEVQLFAICVNPFIVSNDKNTAKILKFTLPELYMGTKRYAIVKPIMLLFIDIDPLFATP